MPIKTHHIVVYSGGMDSFTLLHDVRRNYVKEGDTLRALSFNYGQRHAKELEYGQSVCRELGIPRRVIDLHVITELISNSALTNPDMPVPEGHYAAENMKQTVVPGRNTIMLSVALGFAENVVALSAKEAPLGEVHLAVIYYGAHAGDHDIYPDCRPEHFYAMRDVCTTSSDGAVSLMAPYLHGNKISILTRGLEMGLDYGRSWTCYKGEKHPCEVCGSCTERAEAFERNGVADPLITAKHVYQSSGQLDASSGASTQTI